MNMYPSQVSPPRTPGQFDPLLDIHSDEIKFRVMVVQAIDVSEDSDLNLDAGEGAGTSGMRSPGNNDHSRMLPKVIVLPRLLDFVLSLDEDVVVYASQKAFESLPNVSKSISKLTALKGKRNGVQSSVSWIESGMVGVSFDPYSKTASSSRDRSLHKQCFKPLHCMASSAYDRNPKFANLLVDPEVVAWVNACVAFETEDSAQASLAHNMAVVHNAGHVVLMKQPKAALSMSKRCMK
ncbi:hypothetical protein Tco_0966272 [Tanacetum coccineum]